MLASGELKETETPLKIKYNEKVKPKYLLETDELVYILVGIKVYILNKPEAKLVGSHFLMRSERAKLLEVHLDTQSLLYEAEG